MGIPDRFSPSECDRMAVVLPLSSFKMRSRSLARAVSPPQTLLPTRSLPHDRL
ncbi:MAG: hypothetical protein AB4290_05350 [Spirulina sp.]